MTFFEHQADQEGANMAGFASRDREAHMAHWRKIMDDETIVTRTVLCNGCVAGNIVSWVQEGKREVGYWVGNEYWGKGVATDALSQFLTLVSTRPLYAFVAGHNVGSLRVLQKCGFKVETEPIDGSAGVVLVLGK